MLRNLWKVVRATAMAALAGLAAMAASGAAHGADWPTQPVKIVLPYPPGGASDITARLLGDRLAVAWKVPVVIDNRPGANGIVANELVARAPADGNTILMANLGPNAINHAVYSKLPYDSVRDFAPVILATKVPLILVVASDAPITDLKDLIAKAKDKSAQIAYGSAGLGASSHMAGELLATMAGVKFLHVPYKGDSQALSDLMGGQIVFALPTAVAAASHLKGGRVRALAVTGDARLSSLPDVPTVSEALGLRDYSAVSWGGFMVPAATPQAIVDKLNNDIGRALQAGDLRAKLEAQGALVVGGTPEEFGSFLKVELGKWKRVADTAKIRLD